MTTGKAAVDAFAEDTRRKQATGWSDVATFLKSDAIKEQWYFRRDTRTGSGEAQTIYFLLARDDKNQLWGGFTRF